MVRRSTWIVFGVFLLVTAVAIFLVRSPSSPMTSANQTPSPTEAPRLIQGLTQDQVQSLTLTRAGQNAIELVRGEDGAWTNPGLQINVDAGIGEQLLSELFATRVLTELPPDYSLESIALAQPEQTLTLTSADGSQTQLSVGALTPIGNGYYAQFGKNQPVVVSKYALDAVFQLFDQANTLPTPTVEVTPAP